MEGRLNRTGKFDLGDALRSEFEVVAGGQKLRVSGSASRLFWGRRGGSLRPRQRSRAGENSDQITAIDPHEAIVA